MTIVRFEVTDQQRATDCAIPCGSATCLEVKGFDCGDPMLEFIGCFCGTCCTGAANNALSEAGFADWVFGFLKVELTIRNEHPSVVRVNWIHGGYVKERLTLEPPSASPSP